MAREKDVTRRAKFFVRKKDVTEDSLCERCKHHQYVILIRHQCDAIMYTDTAAKNSFAAALLLASGHTLHTWCIHEDDPPECLEHFKEVRAV